MKFLLKIPGDETAVLLSWPIVYWGYRAESVTLDVAIPWNAHRLRRLIADQPFVNRVLVSDTECRRVLWDLVPADIAVDSGFGPWDREVTLRSYGAGTELYTVTVKQALGLQIPNSLLLLQPSMFVDAGEKTNSLAVLPGNSSRYMKLIESVLRKAPSEFDEVYLLGTEEEIQSWRGVSLEKRVVTDWYEGAVQLMSSRFFIGHEGTGAYVANLLKAPGVCVHTYGFRASSLPWYVTGRGLFSAELTSDDTVEDLTSDIFQYLKEETDAGASGSESS